MKKINWGFIVMFVLIALLTWVGINLVNDVWCYEIESTIIWITGMICLTGIYLMKEHRKLIEKMMNKED